MCFFTGGERSLLKTENEAVCPELMKSWHLGDAWFALDSDTKYLSGAVRSYSTT